MSPARLLPAVQEWLDECGNDLWMPDGEPMESKACLAEKAGKLYRRGSPVIYIIRARISNMWKIGFTTSILARYSQIRCHNHESIQVFGVAPGSEYEEQHIHRILNRHGHHGEWFYGVPDVFAVAHRYRGALLNA